MAAMAAATVRARALALRQQALAALLKTARRDRQRLDSSPSR